MRRIGWLTALGVLALVAAAPAHAHRLAPSYLELIERESGRIDALWKTPLAVAPGSDIVPVFPDHCGSPRESVAARDATSASLRFALHCQGSLVGSQLSVRGLETSRTGVVVHVAFRDGRTFRAVLSRDDPSVRLPAHPSRFDVALDYASLGIRHVLSGADHLLFLWALVLLVSGLRSLAATVTAFTLGHALTISLAAAGFVAFSPLWAEIAIAATLFAVAVELSRPAAERSRFGRHPWQVAAPFGMIHGLGFAGALAGVGLPSGEIPMALLAFNLGIEAGQIAFVVAVLAAVGISSRLAGAPGDSRLSPLFAPLPSYAVGSLAVYWLLDRGAELF